MIAPVLGEQTASLAMGDATACAILGRSAAGWLLPAGADRRRLACLSYGVQVAGSLVLWLGSGQPVAIWLGVALFGRASATPRRCRRPSRRPSSRGRMRSVPCR